MNKEHYLIICNSYSMEYHLFNAVAEYLYAQHVTNLKVHRSHKVITATEPNIWIKFTNIARAYEDQVGFHGTVVDGHWVEKFLDEKRTNNHEN